MDSTTDYGDCQACRELLMKVEADLAEYERELALQQPSLVAQLMAGVFMAGSAFAIAWVIA
jgi:hypothetical protein